MCVSVFVCIQKYKKRKVCYSPALKPHSGHIAAAAYLSLVKKCWLYLYEFLHYSLMQPFVNIFRSYAFALFQFSYSKWRFLCSLSSACVHTRAYLYIYMSKCMCVFFFQYSVLFAGFVALCCWGGFICRQCCQVSQKKKKTYFNNLLFWLNQRDVLLLFVRDVFLSAIWMVFSIALFIFKIVVSHSQKVVQKRKVHESNLYMYV